MYNIWLYELCSDIAYFFVNIYKRITCHKVMIGRGARVNVHSKLEGYNKIERDSIFSGTLGKYSYVGANCLVVGSIGRFCSIGGNVTFITSTHPTKDWVSTHPVFYSAKKQIGISFIENSLFDEHPKKEGHAYSIEVGNDVYIGYGVTIIGPTSIGNGAIIAAGSVVTKDVPSYAIVGGNPAKIIRYRFEPEEIELINESKWWEKDESWLKSNSHNFQSIDLFREINVRIDK